MEKPKYNRVAKITVTVFVNQNALKLFCAPYPPDETDFALEISKGTFNS